MKSYNIICEFSEPVIMNCWKHHAGFIRSRIKVYKNNREPDRDRLLNELLRIGESLMDLYLGVLTPSEIVNSVMMYLNEQIILSRTNFLKWLKASGNDYRIIVLDDTSQWTLRLGEKTNRYVHVHPSRYSPNTIRVRSASLKTAIIYLITENTGSEDRLTFINELRKKYLNLPPLKNLKSAASLLNLIKILT